ncbi:MAG TPA: FixH family protein [Ktedonobacterales bacterium]|nr:FixH family protein [Ktedonobacterales bacterium]
MRPQSQPNQTDEQQNTDAPIDDGSSASASGPERASDQRERDWPNPERPSAPAPAQPPAAAPLGGARSPAEIAKIRRRVIWAALAILAVLLVAGLGESFAGFIPHTTPPFANGKTQTAGELRVTIQFTPNPPRISGDPTTQVKLLIEGQNNQTIDGAEVQLDLSMVTMDMGVNRFTAQGLGQGRYQAQVAFLMIGQWNVQVSITPPGGSAVTTTFTVDVAA